MKLLLRKTTLVFLDVMSIALALYGALALRFNGPIPVEFTDRYLIFIGPLIVIGIVVFYLYRLYQSLWRYASAPELKNIVIATITDTIILYVITDLICNMPFPRSSVIIYWLLLTLFICLSRFSYRFLRLMKSSYQEEENSDRVMIVGAGVAGEKIYREIQNSTTVNKKVVCFIDDDPHKIHHTIHGTFVYGGMEKIIEAAKKYEVDEIIVAIPSLDNQRMSIILNICKETKCKIKKIPGMYQLINGEIHMHDLQDVEVEDLLGRDPIKVDLNEIMGYVTDKTVMVLGAGGSIGSELSRQIAQNKPKQLIMVDIYENSLYDIQLELQHDYPDLPQEALIASIRNTKKMDVLFEQYHPDIVYHAAAHKHVPLMEDSPNEAVKNNVFGTLNVAKMADKHHTKRVILISTDKAVNPTNIMGATKRICEMIFQTYNKHSDTEYVAVRFGNVLGSNGSVIPLFKKQIKEGGPVTVTHPDIIRYFMTIPEAVSLVLQAGAYAKGGEIFILDMGKPVKILDMAKNLIKLSGYEPDVDIKIEFVGLRPGEKLYEELLMKEEGLQNTPNDLIHIGKPIEFNEEIFFEQLTELKKAAYDETTHIRSMVKNIVTTYTYKADE